MAPSKACCVYFNCKRNRLTHPELSFFRFPLDLVRSNKWFENCGNVNLLGLSLKELNKKTVCAMHFSEKSFMNTLRNSLVKNAIPINYTEDPGCINEPVQMKIVSSPESLILKREVGVKTYGSCSFKSDLVLSNYDNTCAVEDSIGSKVLQKILEMPTPQKRKRRSQVTSPTYRMQINLLKRKIVRKDVCIDSLKKKSKHSLTSALPKYVRVFINMQLYHKSNNPWRKDEKELALSMYYKSPALYLFLRDNFKFTLPSKTTIASWLRMSQLCTGTDTKVLRKLSSKVKTMTTEEKECVLLMDEMSIKKGIEYNSQLDLIEDFQDLGHLDRDNKIATQALVFMARGLMKKWKIPISYYLSATSVKHQELRALVIQNIIALQCAGLNVRVLVCDQAATNRAVFQLLGITPDQPFFNVNGKKFAIYDVPHLIKSVRNNLMSHDIYVDQENASWRDIKTVYYLDKASNTARTLTRISECHINPNTFQKMRVKYVTQIFSRTVSAAIKTCVNIGQIKSNSALNTSDFLLKMNNLFDILNSRILNSPNPFQSALSIRRPRLEIYLREIIDWIAKWHCFTAKNKIKEGIYCFRGLRQSINATLLLWEDLKSNGFQFLLTNRLNQDPLENLFATIRRKSGNNNNPTAKSFRQSLQWNIAIKLLKPPENSNCEVDEDVDMQIEDEVEETFSHVEHDISMLFDDNLGSNIESKSSVCNEEEQRVRNKYNTNNITTLEDCAIVYFAGYVVHKTLKDLVVKNSIIYVLKNH